MSRYGDGSTSLVSILAFFLKKSIANRRPRLVLSQSALSFGTGILPMFLNLFWPVDTDTRHLMRNLSSRSNLFCLHSSAIAENRPMAPFQRDVTRASARSALRSVVPCRLRRTNMSATWPSGISLPSIWTGYM